MPNEATKTRRFWDEKVLRILEGEGIDIGCGNDPVLPHVDRFDRAQGDANRITAFVKKQYDFVFASHVLEHMDDPVSALREWFALVKPGGHLVCLVPDEDLYEQGVFPSLFNDDHKHTFTLSKARSWSPRSVNVIELVRAVPGEVVSLELQDQGYDRRMMQHAPGRYSLILLTLWRRAERNRWLRRFPGFWNSLFTFLGAPVDQTALPDPRLAQIQFIIRRPLA